jgi:hypothetical protein
MGQAYRLARSPEGLGWEDVLGRQVARREGWVRVGRGIECFDEGGGHSML